MSRRFHSGSLILRQKQRYCMARSVVGEGFRQPGQTQLLSPERQQELVKLLTCLVPEYEGNEDHKGKVSVRHLHNHVFTLTFLPSLLAVLDHFLIQCMWKTW